MNRTEEQTTLNKLNDEIDYLENVDAGIVAIEDAEQIRTLLTRLPQAVIERRALVLARRHREAREKAETKAAERRQDVLQRLALGLADIEAALGEAKSEEERRQLTDQAHKVRSRLVEVEASPADAIL